MAETLCRGCGLVMNVNRSDHVWCSKRCHGRGENWTARRVTHCVHCGQGLPAGSDIRRRYCSDRCKAARSDAAARADGRFERWYQITLERSRKPKFTTACVVCGGSFETNRAAKYCSNRCSAKASYEARKNSAEYKAARLGYDQRRRARKRTTGEIEIFSAAEIFSRDKYRCHCCGVKCKPNVVVPHLLAPTLDHLVPLAEGGAHTRANIATACFHCNSVKGERGGGEQLAVI